VNDAGRRQVMDAGVIRSAVDRRGADIAEDVGVVG
jgi:hypothetical protein